MPLYQEYFTQSRTCIVSHHGAKYQLHRADDSIEVASMKADFLC